MADTFNKKSVQQKKAKKKQDKLAQKEARKKNNDKGKTLEDMMVYLDEYGNITDVPPEKQKRTPIKEEDILIGATPIVEQTEFSGILSLFFSDKAYGFITEDDTRENVFVHSSKFTELIKEKDRVVYEKEKTPRGFAAINVRKVK